MYQKAIWIKLFRWYLNRRAAIGIAAADGASPPVCVVAPDRKGHR